MLKTQKELLRVLDENGITYTNHQHPAVYTVEQAALYHEGIDGVHSKNLFLKDKKKNLFLVVTLSDKHIVIKEVAKKIGAKSPSFGKSELLDEVLGVIPGAVTPFAVIKLAHDDPMPERRAVRRHGPCRHDVAPGHVSIKINSIYKMSLILKYCFLLKF